MRDEIKKILPDSAIRYITGLFYGWSGNYSSWEEAERKCTGYDSEIILRKVKDSALKVKQGQAAFERDSVMFYEPHYSKHLEKAVDILCNKKKAKLNIVDFGGSLGSTYFQNRANIGDRISGWCIIEQEGFVAEGKKNFEEGVLHFHNKIENCIEKKAVDLLILSSVLQYIKDPYSLLDKLLEYKPTGVCPS